MLFAALSFAAPPDAGAPVADAGTLLQYARDFQREARQVRDFLAGRLDGSVDPQSLFDVPMDTSDERMQVERERVELLLRSADVSARPTAPPAEESPSQMTTNRLTPGVNPPTGIHTSPVAAPTAPRDPAAWRARLALDRERLAFYALSAARRLELVREHEARRERAESTAHDEAQNQVEAEARRAERQQLEALDAARRSRTEAARLINEEHARLLSVTRDQAQYEGGLLQRRADLDARNETVLAWRRKVAELTSSGPIKGATRQAVDEAYVALRVTLRQARQLLADALSSRGDGDQRVPQAGADPLVDLPADADRSVAAQQRGAVTAKARELSHAEHALAIEETRQLMSEVEALNRLRLELLGCLSAEKRDSVLGFGPAGWDQAVSEVWQVVLTARYHLQAAFDWLAAIRGGDQRGRSAWLAFVLVLKWTFPIGLFAWWRRRADRVLEQWLGNRRQQARARRDGEWFEVDYAERLVAFLRRVRRPLEWLLLVGLVTWLMPAEMKGLLEVRLLSRVLLWVFGGLFIVLSIDALASSNRLQSSTTATARLRLRSLRLVGRGIVAFGLPLSLSDLLVGQGTVYSWVFSTCWFAAVPLLFVIVAWWRPHIFERFARMRKPNDFETWVLGQRSPVDHTLASALSSIAAVAGGVYLFVLGAWRVLRGRVVTFELTRRLLAYLFRRDLSKKARATPEQAYGPLTADIFRALGPEVPSLEPVRSAADPQVEAVIDRIRSSGGGAVAIVGERGSGKTMLMQRIIEHCADLVKVTCDVDGLPGLRLQLNQALGLSPTTTLELAATTLDNRVGDRGLLIDDAQYLIRPMMGGLAEFDSVLALFRRHSTNCTWILAFDEAIWRFIEQSRTQPLFDEVVRLSAWSEDAIVRLITQRNETARLAPDFRELAIDLPADADGIDISEAVHRTEANYYRLLWDYASGNPGVALHFWRRSLGVGPSGKVLVRLFDAPDATHLEALPDSSAFVLRAIVQLGSGAPLDIARVTSLPLAQVEDALRYGNQHGYFQIDGERYSVNWDWFRAVTRLLQRRHLSFSSP